MLGIYLQEWILTQVDAFHSHCVSALFFFIFQNRVQHWAHIPHPPPGLNWIPGPHFAPTAFQSYFLPGLHWAPGLLFTALDPLLLCVWISLLFSSACPIFFSLLGVFLQWEGLSAEVRCWLEISLFIYSCSIYCHFQERLQESLFTLLSYLPLLLFLRVA